MGIDINADIKKLITENLPATTAGVMSDFITKAERTSDELDNAKTTINKQVALMKNKNEEIEKLKKQVCKINAFKNRDKDVAVMEEDLRIEKRDIDLKIALIRLEAANDRNNKIEVLVEKVFGLPSVSVNTSKNKPVMVGPDGSTPWESSRIQENESTITTKSKI